MSDRHGSLPVTLPAPRYRAFISYSHRDARIARRLHQWLEGYRVPRRLVGRSSPLGPVPARLRPIFRDREELPSSADLGGQILSALRESGALIVLCSPRSAASRWVNEEILAYKRLGRADRILALIVDGEPNATSNGEAARECFPPALRFHLDAAGGLSTEPAEPIAADLRPFGDGLRDARLKLAAGLLGVGFDDLKQRELQRQLRRAVTFAIGAAALLLVLAVLAVTALRSRAEAERQRAAAAAERDRAERNFRDARDAVDRFYTKVSEDQLLRAEGLQPLRAQLLQEALGYYRRFLEQRAGDAALGLEAAIVRVKVGGILSDVGEAEEALREGREATQALEAHLASDGANPVLLEHLSESLGNEAINLDRLDRVEEAFAAQVRALAFFERLPEGAQAKSPAEWQRLLMVQGAFAARLGRLEEARRSYERGLEIAPRLAREMAPLGLSLEPAAGGLLVVAVQAGSPAETVGFRPGDVLQRLGETPLRRVEDMSVARDCLTPGLAVAVSFLRGGARMDAMITPVWLGELVTAAIQYNLGSLQLERLRQPERARPWLEKSVDEYRRVLLRESPSSGDARSGLAVAANALGNCGRELQDAELEERGRRLGLAAAEANVRVNPAVPRYRSALATNLGNHAIFLRERGDLAGAAERATEAARQLRTALEMGGDLVDERFNLVRALINLASITSEKDGAPAALPIYASALAAAEPLVQSGQAPGHLPLLLAQLQANRASSELRAGRIDDAVNSNAAAARHYEEAMARTDPPPAWLLDEAARLDGRQAALLSRLGRDPQARTHLSSLAARCRLLLAAPTGPQRIGPIRLRSAEKFLEESTALLPADPRATLVLLSLAEDQLAEASTAPVAPAGIRPAQASVHVRRALALQLQGRAADAVAALGPWRELVAQDAALRVAAEEEIRRLAAAGVAAEWLDSFRAALAP